MEITQETPKHLHFYGEKEIKKKSKRIKVRVSFTGVVKDNALQIGFAECSKKDTFVKKLGRTIATGRAETKPSLIVNIKNDENKDKRLPDLFISLCKGLLKSEA